MPSRPRFHDCNLGSAIRRSLGVAAVAFIALVPPVLADPPATPYGPGVPDNQNISLSSLLTYDELLRHLLQIEATSRGAVIVDAAPWTSNTGRVVPYAVIGNGPTKILIVAQQHGNEMVTNDSAMQVIKALSTGSKAAKTIRERLTVIVVPRVNVDGFDGENADGTPITDTTSGNIPPWRQNYDPRFTVNPLPAFYQRGRGFDINRYHGYRPECPLDNPNVGGVTSCEAVDTNNPALGNPVPEAKNVRWLFDQYHPSYVLDLHHQGTLVDANGDLVTGSTLWPSADATANALSVAPGGDPSALARFQHGQLQGKKTVAVLVEHMRQFGYSNLTKYNGGPEPGISRNAYGLLGAGSVLLELRGGIGQKSNGYIARIGFEVVMSVLDKLVQDPTLATVDASIADTLLPHGTGVPGPKLEEEEGEAHE